MILAPGPDTALVTKNALVHGRRPAHERAPVRTLHACRQGLFSNLANPKIAAFFTSFLPQFIAPGEPVTVPFLLLGGLFVGMTVAWLIVYAVLASKAAAS